MQQYVIKRNDTIYLIAKKFNIPIAQLIKANPQIVNPFGLYIDQILQIPDFLPIPKQLDIIESNAEDIIDDLYKSDWQKAEDKLNIIKNNMNELIPILQKSAVSDELISGMNQAIKSLEENIKKKSTNPAIAQANKITKYIPDIYDFFKVIIPTDVSRLDYLGREIIVNVKNIDWTEANNNYLRANVIWNRLKKGLNIKYSKDIVEFDQILSALDESISKKDSELTIENANKMLDAVDILETDFTQQNA